MNHSTKTYFCRVCGIEKKLSHHTTNIYCSKKCNGIGQKLETIERFKSGLVSDRDTLRRTLKEVVGYYCSVCGIIEYNNEPITLQVDHIDGNAGNNMPDNLRLICPNCHSQTKTFGARNKGNGRKSRGLSLK